MWRVPARSLDPDGPVNARALVSIPRPLGYSPCFPCLLLTQRSSDRHHAAQVLLDSLEVISVFRRNLKPSKSTISQAIAPRKNEQWESQRFDERERSWVWRHKCPSITRSQ